MLDPELKELLKKRWYLALAALIGVVVIAYVLYLLSLDPRGFLEKYGYKLILGWTFLEGETIVILAGWMAASLGVLRPELIALCAFCGSFASDQVMFSLGKYKGPAVLRYFPRVAKNMDRATGLFKKYDTILILCFRFVYGVRNVTPIMLGISGVSHKKFFFLNSIGAGIWALTFAYGGYYAYATFIEVAGYVGHGILYALLAALGLAALLWYLRARHNVRHAASIAAAAREQSGQGEDDACAENAATGKDGAAAGPAVSQEADGGLKAMTGPGKKDAADDNAGGACSARANDARAVDRDRDRDPDCG